jgi:hypothetical protein
VITLDAAYLADVGLERLPPNEANLLLHHLYETLELRVGRKLASRMTDAQLDEFQVFIDSGAEDRALEWLEVNFPDYRDVVHAEFESLTSELRQSGPLMLALVGFAA